MKKLLSLLLSVALIMGVSLPAHAEDLEDGQSSVPIVSTLDELQTAIDEAENGVTIAIARGISVNGALKTDKNITLVRADGFTATMVYLYSGSEIAGFRFIESDECGDTILVSNSSEGATIQDCSFSGNINHTRPYVSIIGGGNVTNSLQIEDCNFTGNKDTALSARANTVVEVNSCVFTDNSAGMQGGAINSAGIITITNCTITGNSASAGGGVFCSGEITITDCRFDENTVTGENMGADIFSTGTLSITDEMDEAAGYFEMTTGEKVPLPLEASTQVAKLAYFTTEEAEEYFAPVIVPPAPGQNMVVNDIKELQAAIAQAQSGDTIEIGKKVLVEKDISIGLPGKAITLTRADGYTDMMLEIRNAEVSIREITFDGKNLETAQVAVNSYNSKIYFERCTICNNKWGGVSLGCEIDAVFDSCDFERNYSPLGMGYAGSIEIIDCTFKENTGLFACVDLSGTIIVTGTRFEDNNVPVEGGALMIRAISQATIADCQFLKNHTEEGCGAAIFNGGNTTISNSLFCDNSSNVAGNDIFCWGDGVISIADAHEKLTALYSASDLQFKGIYTDFADSRYSALKETIKLELPCSDYAGALCFVLQAEEISAPDNDNPPQRPQESPEDDDRDEEDYTPPTAPKPVQVPSTPNTATSADTPARMLKCGDAVIDTSRSVVLAGYGDGLLHEDDPLTRAQLATIIYRLLSKGTLEKYQTYDSPFADVNDGAWCTDYIATLARAGIINGIGNGEYNPDGVVTWAQVLTVLSRFTEPQEYDLQQIQYDGWALDAVQTAVALEWIEDRVDFDPNASISRGELVELVNGILEKY